VEPLRHQKKKVCNIDEIVRVTAAPTDGTKMAGENIAREGESEKVRADQTKNRAAKKGIATDVTNENDVSAIEAGHYHQDHRTVAVLDIIMFLKVLRPASLVKMTKEGIAAPSIARRLENLRRGLTWRPLRSEA
jgi:hypothetical protein